jgi:uncharacterized protein YabE (DUF348 family)
MQTCLNSYVRFKLAGTAQRLPRLHLVYSALEMDLLIQLRHLLEGRLKTLAGLLAAAGLVLLFLGTQRHITVRVDGEMFRGTTHARTVGGALRDLGIEIDPNDRVIPPQEQLLSRSGQIEVNKAQELILDVDGQQSRVEVVANTPTNLLADQGIRLFPGDTVYVDGLPMEDLSMKIYPHTRIRLVRGHTLTVLDGDTYRTIRSSASTLGVALHQVGIELFGGDRVTPDLDTALESDLAVTILRADWLSIQVDDRELRILSTGETVADALASAGLALKGSDYTIPDLEAPLPDSRRIRVVRVDEEDQIVLEPVPFETVYQPLDTLELDSIQVVDAGTYGVLQNRVRVRLEDGQEVSRTVDEARVVVEPKPRILGYGTKIVVRTLSTSYGTIEYWRAIPIYATSYSPCNLGVAYCGERTASGKSVQRGVIGVIRSWYNLMRGWPVFVPDYGPGTFEDIGGGIAGRDWIDLGFTDENFEPWHQWTTLYFLTPVPSLESIPWILP